MGFSCSYRLFTSFFFFCLDSLNSFCFLSLVPIVPIKTYSNAEVEKDQILSDNQNKSGVYMWKNSINGKRYIGSSENLNRRFSEYFNQNYLLRNKSMAICCALLKHGHSNFSLIILEYCLVADLLIREKHYQKTLKPEYNIAKEPGAPMSGRTHSDDTKKIISDASKGEKNSMFGKNHSDDTKTKISDAMIGNTNRKGQPKVEGSGRPSQQIEVTDIKKNITTYYDSIHEAARALAIKH